MMMFSFISTISLKEILKELDSSLSEEELEGIIDEVDTDGSGTLDFDGDRKHIETFTVIPQLLEFVQMMIG